MKYKNKIHLSNLNKINLRKNLHKPSSYLKFKNLSYENKYSKIKEKEIKRENAKLYKKLNEFNKNINNNKKNMSETYTEFKKFKILSKHNQKLEKKKLINNNIKMIKKIKNAKSIYKKSNYYKHQKQCLKAMSIKSKYPILSLNKSLLNFSYLVF